VPPARQADGGQSRGGGRDRDLMVVRGELAAVLAMLDRSQFTYLCYTPEVPPAAHDRAYASGQQSFAAWREAVVRLLKAAGRPAPWPLADPEGTASLAPGGPQGTASGNLEAGPPSRPGAD
jgi:hypothetical protein